jgi:hypothetical protein
MPGNQQNNNISHENVVTTWMYAIINSYICFKIYYLFDGV